MRKFMMVFLMLLGLAYSQTPIIRLMQSREYKTPKYWWRDQETFKLRGYLADDTTGLANPTNGVYTSTTKGVAYKNNNFDAWRDSVMTIAVTLDDDGATVTAFRLDIVFDNDLFTWDNTTITGHDSTRVEKGAYLASYSEGDTDSTDDYSYEVTWYNNVGYVDSIQTAGSEKSSSDSRYDWLRITMVSHSTDSITFGNGAGKQVELLKLHFKVNDVVDNFGARDFRVATKYEGNTGYYTYVTNGNYLTTYKVFIDGNVGQWGDGVGKARGNITLHPKLLDVEGYFRYIQGHGRATGAVWDYEDNSPTWERGPQENTYPYWKIKFELDHNEANFSPRITNWTNPELISKGTEAQHDGTVNKDDVIGHYASGANGYFYDKKSTRADQVVPAEGFLGISYYDSTYTDDKGYYSIQLPRNNRYRISFWPPDASDDIETHDQFELDRRAITTVADAVKSFNHQSSKFKNYNAGGTRIDTLTALEYLIADVDGDDVFQLNDTYILWSYITSLLNNYTHHNGDSYEDWSTIEVFKEGGSANNYVYYQTVNGQSRPQKYEFTVFWDETTLADKSRLDRTSENPYYFVNNNRGNGDIKWLDSLKAPMAVTKKLLDAQRVLNVDGNFAGQVEILNPLMDDHQTGLDTLHLILGAGYSSWSAARTSEKNGYSGNPDYLMPDIAYYFTGDVNATGTKVKEINDGKTGRGSTTPNGYIDNEGSTFYRWGGSAPSHHLNKINDGNDEPNNTLSGFNNSGDFEDGVDVILSLPADSTVRVQSGNQIEIPLTITPREGVNIAGFEFEVEFDTTVLHFIDMKTDILPGPWMTYVNVHEPVDNYRRVSFGGIDYSPGNAPETYHITKEMVGLNLVFEAAFPDTEWTQAPINFIGKHAASDPNGRDLNMSKSDGEVWVWNKYWAFGGGKPDEEAMTYNYPNPFMENTTFQFFLDESKDVKLYILNSIGQRVGTLLDEHILEGLHTFEFTNEPSVFLPGVSAYENHQKLEPGVYIFVLQTDNRIKANKFTVVK